MLSNSSWTYEDCLNWILFVTFIFFIFGCGRFWSIWTRAYLIMFPRQVYYLYSYHKEPTYTYYYSAHTDTQNPNPPPYILWQCRPNQLISTANHNNSKLTKLLYLYDRLELWEIRGCSFGRCLLDGMSILVFGRMQRVDVRRLKIAFRCSLLSQFIGIVSILYSIYKISLFYLHILLLNNNLMDEMLKIIMDCFNHALIWKRIALLTHIFYPCNSRFLLLSLVLNMLLLKVYVNTHPLK